MMFGIVVAPVLVLVFKEWDWQIRVVNNVVMKRSDNLRGKAIVHSR